MIEDKIIDEAINKELKKTLKKLGKGAAKAALATACAGAAVGGTLYAADKQATEREAQQKKDYKYMHGGHSADETEKMLNGTERDRNDYNKSSEEFYKKLKVDEMANFTKLMERSGKTVLI